jgi:uncharacterized membrane protein YgdD (TMEM256/DUF423 family)
MNKLLIQSGAIFGALSVAFGAFGAHALKEMLTASNHFETYETAVRYQFYHALALILLGILTKDFPSKFTKYAGNAFLVGIIIFSGSLYAICFTGIKMFGAIAPIGGLSLIIGWVLLFWGVKKS